MRLGHGEAMELLRRWGGASPPVLALAWVREEAVEREGEREKGEAARLRLKRLRGRGV